MDKTQNILVYDLEIIKAIPGKNEPALPGIKYCAGWEDHLNMGISVIAAYTYLDDRYHVFCGDNFQEFQDLVTQTDDIVGFNSVLFDDRVCLANGITVMTTYDILRETYRALGMNPYPEFFTSDYAGYGLDIMCQANQCGAKTGHGAVAPVLWQQGKIGTVIDYCLQDVHLTKQLFDKVLAGVIINPKTGQPIQGEYRKLYSKPDTIRGWF